MARSYLRHFLSGLVVLLLLGCSAQLSAQSGMNAADSLKAEILQQRTTLALADSVGDLHAAFEARMQLVPLVRRTESIDLLKQAATIADSLDRPDLGAMAHRLLAKSYASGGNPAAAYAESIVVDSLDRIREMREMERSNDQHARMLEQIGAAQDSLAQAGLDRERRLAVALVQVQSDAGSWMWVSLVAIGLCLVIVLVLLYRMGRTSRKLRATIDALRKEVDGLKVTTNRRRKADTRDEVICAIPASGLVEPPTPPIHEAMKPVAEGMFRKGAPERLATLRQARELGDNDKILRVVTTLKPLLVSFDEARFTPLFARLKAAGASNNAQQWTADLDALDFGVQELLSDKDQ